LDLADGMLPVTLLSSLKYSMFVVLHFMQIVRLFFFVPEYGKTESAKSAEAEENVSVLLAFLLHLICVNEYDYGND